MEVFQFFLKGEKSWGNCYVLYMKAFPENVNLWATSGSVEGYMCWGGSVHEEWAAAAAMEGRAVGHVASLETFTFGKFLPLKKKKKGICICVLLNTHLCCLSGTERIYLSSLSWSLLLFYICQGAQSHPPLSSKTWWMQISIHCKLKVV